MVDESGAEQVGEADQESSTGRKRDRTLIEFPYTDISRAEDLTEKLSQAGGKVWIDQTQLAVAMDMSAGGGTFRSRLSAAKMFGFVETEGGKVRLSSLGIELLDENTARAAKVEAFLRVPLYKRMFESYNGFALPPAAAIERQMTNLGVPPKQAERARQAFASSAQAAGYIASNGRFSKPMVTPVEAKEEEGPETGGNGGGGGGGRQPPRDPPVTEKALEYKLVDLMSEALDKPEVMQAIITVVTFLKAREAVTSLRVGPDAPQTE
jgi:hypothetical protein